MKNRHVLFSLLCLTGVVLSSCTNSPASDTTGQGAGRFRSGSGSYQRGGSGSFMNAFSGMTSEDRALFQQMRDARRNGDTATADSLQATLQKKYPNLRFGGGRGRMDSSQNQNTTNQ